MPIKRTYGDGGDGCMFAHAMDLVEDHWSSIIVRELLLGPKRFTDLAEAASGITPAVLTTRLQQLRDRGLLTDVELPPPARGRAYDLTDWGRRLQPIFLALGRWALESPTRPTTGDLTPDAAALALLAMAPQQRMEPAIEVELHLTDRRRPEATAVRYHLRWDDRLEVTRGSSEAPTCTVRADATALVRAWIEGASTDLAIDGDTSPATRLAAALSPA